jgi:hypothetical protein
MPPGQRRLTQNMTSTLIASVIVLVFAGLAFHAWFAGAIAFILMVGSTWWVDRRRGRQLR